MYDEFSESFSQKRKNPWKPFLNFIQSLEKTQEFQNCADNGIWCDLGTGNGRHLQIITQYSQKYIGTDISFSLVHIARTQNDPKKQHNWIACDLNALPFRKNTFQSIVSIAVLHHILGKHQLRKLMHKINQLLTKNGIFILSLWGAFKGKNESTLKRKNFHRRMSNLPIIQAFSGKRIVLGVNDVVVPWTMIQKHNQPIKKPRFYHLYSVNELQTFKEIFNTIKFQAVYMGKNAGMNYFLCLAKIYSNLMA